MRCLSHGIQAVATALAAGWATLPLDVSAAVLIRDASLTGGDGAPPERIVDLLIEDGVFREIGEVHH